jgi:hypothetical protein
MPGCRLEVNICFRKTQGLTISTLSSPNGESGCFPKQWHLTNDLPEGKARPSRKADNLVASEAYSSPPFLSYPFMFVCLVFIPLSHYSFLPMPLAKLFCVYCGIFSELSPGY